MIRKHAFGSLKNWLFFSVIFLLLFITFISVDEFNFIHFYTYLFRVKGLFKFFSSLFLYSGLIISMILLLLSANRYLKVFAYFLLVFSFVTEASYFIVNGYGFTYTEASLWLREAGFTGDAVVTFLPVVWFVPLAAFAFAGILYYITQKFILKTSWKLSVPFSMFFILLSFYVLRGTSGEQTYPTMFKTPVLLVYAATNPVFLGPRNRVSVEPVRPSEYKNIIFIVDESVRGDMISLNDPACDATPFLLSVSANILNFGIMSSGGNQSANSQLILRSGVKSEVFPDTLETALKIPDILQYAKKAGYTVNYLDGQKDIMQNYMKDSDRSSIDHYTGVKEKSMDGWKIDYLLADSIVKYLADTTKHTFTYVVKMGAHFHYENYYPQDKKIFQPTLKIGELNNDRQKMINSYKNLIRWNIDEFFRYLTENLGVRKDYIIIYTSDHGQTLLDHGIKSTHSDVKNAHPFQAMVPFFIYFSDTIQKNKFAYREDNFDKLSHFNIFPSLLLIMGYDSAFVRKNYEMSIFDDVPLKPRYFYTGILFMKGNGYKTLFDTPEMSTFLNRLEGIKKTYSNKNVRR